MSCATERKPEPVKPFARFGFGLHGLSIGYVVEIDDTLTIENNSVIVDGHRLEFNLDEMQHIRLYITDDRHPIIGAA